jgi:hypothetical protein
VPRTVLDNLGVRVLEGPGWANHLDPFILGVPKTLTPKMSQDEVFSPGLANSVVPNHGVAIRRTQKTQRPPFPQHTYGPFPSPPLPLLRPRLISVAALKTQSPYTPHLMQARVGALC